MLPFESNALSKIQHLGEAINETPSPSLHSLPWLYCVSWFTVDLNKFLHDCLNSPYSRQGNTVNGKRQSEINRAFHLRRVCARGEDRGMVMAYMSPLVIVPRYGFGGMPSRTRDDEEIQNQYLPQTKCMYQDVTIDVKCLNFTGIGGQYPVWISRTLSSDVRATC